MGGRRHGMSWIRLAPYAVRAIAGRILRVDSANPASSSEKYSLD